MDKMIKYQCTNCGQEHESWPALAFKSPAPYNALSDFEKETIAELTSDFCVINGIDQADFFIRCTFSQLVLDHCDDLEYGVWVSLSEKSFRDYSDNYYNDQHQAGYFGWLSNNIPDYVFEDSIPLNVDTQIGNKRPVIEPHQSFQHPFVHDFYNGITKAEAERRIDFMLNAQKNS